VLQISFGADVVGTHVREITQRIGRLDARGEHTIQVLRFELDLLFEERLEYDCSDARLRHAMDV
jgi:hypothetical protein